MASRSHEARLGITLTCADCGRLARPFTFSRWTVQLGKETVELFLCRKCSGLALEAKAIADLAYKRRLVRIGSKSADPRNSSNGASK